MALTKTFKEFPRRFKVAIKCYAKTCMSTNISKSETAQAFPYQSLSNSWGIDFI